VSGPCWPNCRLRLDMPPTPVPSNAVLTLLIIVHSKMSQAIRCHNQRLRHVLNVDDRVIDDGVIEKRHRSQITGAGGISTSDAAGNGLAMRMLL
jgi:hypothetical protein